MATPASSASGAESKTEPGKGHWIEPIVVVLLSLATVGTAWCSYQAATWSGVSQRLTQQSAAAARDAAAAELEFQQFALLDVLLFTQHLNARVTTNETLAAFYSRRFRPEARAAFDAWMATRPFENPEALPHPFVTNFYRPAVLTEAQQLKDESARLWTDSSAAGLVARSYILITVLLASALFCAGTASRLDQLAIRRAVLGLGLAVFLAAAFRLLTLPAQL